jgi:hypothetical protein
MAEIRMTEREKALSRASEAGENDFFRRGSINPAYEKDAGLKQAWEQGYKRAKQNEIAWQRYEQNIGRYHD